MGEKRKKKSINWGGANESFGSGFKEEKTTKCPSTTLAEKIVKKVEAKYTKKQ